jgi:hypothetical protein
MLFQIMLNFEFAMSPQHFEYVKIFMLHLWRWSSIYKRQEMSLYFCNENDWK